MCPISPARSSVRADPFYVKSKAPQEETHRRTDVVHGWGSQTCAVRELGHLFLGDRTCAQRNSISEGDSKMTQGVCITAGQILF